MGGNERSFARARSSPDHFSFFKSPGTKGAKKGKGKGKKEKE